MNQAVHYTDAAKADTEYVFAGRDCGLLSAGVMTYFTKTAQLKRRAKCTCMKGADTQTPLERLWTKQLQDFL